MRLRLAKIFSISESGEIDKVGRKVMLGMRRLGCCTRDTQLSIDFDQNEHNRIITYDGLESYILQSQSLDGEDTSCSSSSKDALGSFFSHSSSNEEADEWGSPASSKHFQDTEKPAKYTTRVSDVEAMKEKFTKLLLGEDVTGGSKGISSALAISNAITNLAGTVFGELWKLEPLPEEMKTKWRKEMNWLISPANHMVELVPAMQNGTNGPTFEIMTPRARADVHMNLPALQKLDSILIESLDSVVGIEFWYEDNNNSAEIRKGITWPRKRWWLPSPRVPTRGLSDVARKKLISVGNLVHQVFKAAKSINENVLHEMPVPEVIQNSIPKSGRVALGEGLFKIITSESLSASEIVDSLNLKSEHEALDIVNKLENTVLALKDTIKELKVSNNRTSWSFMGSTSEVDKTESLLLRVEALMHQLKMRYPRLPHTFVDVTKIRYGKDIGHSIIEAYSRVLSNLAYRIISRIKEVWQEDRSSNPDSPMPIGCFSSEASAYGISSRRTEKPRIRHSLLDQMNRVDGYFSDSNPSRSPDSEISSSTDTCKYNSSVNATPCSRKDTGNHWSPYASPWMK